MDKPCLISWRCTDEKGYARCNVRRFGVRIQRAHVLAWIDYHGRLPGAGMSICHSRFPGGHPRNCVEPTHLREDTHTGNMRDRFADGMYPNALKTHCTQGHPYDEANTFMRPSGARRCRACERESARRRSKRLREAS